MKPGQPSQTPASLALRSLAFGQVFAATGLVVTSIALPDALSHWAWLTILAVVVVLWWLLRRTTRAVADRSAAGLDERDLAARNRVSWWGFAIAVSGGTATALALIVGTRVSTVSAQVLLDRAGATLISLMLVAAVAPTTILAATTAQEDDPDDDR